MLLTWSETRFSRETQFASKRCVSAIRKQSGVGHRSVVATRTKDRIWTRLHRFGSHRVIRDAWDRHPLASLSGQLGNPQLPERERGHCSGGRWSDVQVRGRGCVKLLTRLSSGGRPCQNTTPVSENAWAAYLSGCTVHTWPSSWDVPPLL